MAAALAPVAVAPVVAKVIHIEDTPLLNVEEFRQTAVSPHPDAELIRLCGEYIEALDAYGLADSDMDPDADPLWQAIEALEEHLNGLTARTLDGVAALARVAQRWALQPDGSENFDTSYTGDWPERVVLNVLMLQAEARS